MLVYATHVNSVEELIAGAETIRQNLAMSERIQTSMAWRIQEGRHFEQYLCSIAVIYIFVYLSLSLK